MAELRVTDPEPASQVLFAGAVAPPPAPVYTQLAVITNPNPEPGADPASVTLYTSDQDGDYQQLSAGTRLERVRLAV